ncbi:MAG: EAL and HDOD domain-containing protein [Burkholderiales bacterium]
MNAGFRVGWKLGESSEAVMSILTSCEFIQIETPGFDGVQLKELARKLRRANRPDCVAPIKLTARDVQTSDDFQLCFRAGFDYFQGPFVTNRENWAPPRSEIDTGRVIQILSRLRNGADHAVIAKELRMEPVLTYKLLRYVNSAAMGFQRQIATIDQALLALGGQKLYRWLSLLLFDMKIRGFVERTLIEQVLVRARMMESLGAKTVDPNLAFLTGLLSLLDKVLGRPIADLLPQIGAPREVEDALITRTGPYVHLLDLVIACEQSDQGLIAVTAAVCGVDENAVNAQLIAAMNWAYEVMALTE